MPFSTLFSSKQYFIPQMLATHFILLFRLKKPLASIVCSVSSLRCLGMLESMMHVVDNIELLD